MHEYYHCIILNCVSFHAAKMPDMTGSYSEILGKPLCMTLTDDQPSFQQPHEIEVQLVDPSCSTGTVDPEDIQCNIDDFTSTSPTCSHTTQNTDIEDQLVADGNIQKPLGNFRNSTSNEISVNFDVPLKSNLLTNHTVKIAKPTSLAVSLCTAQFPSDCTGAENSTAVVGKGRVSDGNYFRYYSGSSLPDADPDVSCRLCLYLH